MNPLQTAKRYFEVSNQSDFGEISKLLDESSTYSSQNTGLYLGANSIVEMQKVFHASFEKLHWDIEEISEEKPGIIKVYFRFFGIKNGEEVIFSALEYIIVVDGVIRHIEIRNK